MKLLTVSIAAYHVEDYLRETLDSFLIPEVTDQLEVLIVNDGSGEGVNEIAREYQTNYPDVFRLIDKENGGHVRRYTAESKRQRVNILRPLTGTITCPQKG